MDSGFYWRIINQQSEKELYGSTDDSLKVSSEAKTWYSDGNFNLRLTYFYNVIKVQNKLLIIYNYYSVGTVYWKCMTISIYEGIFNLILTNCAEH